MAIYNKIPIFICKLNKNKSDQRLFYCTNKGLIYAIGLIGICHGERLRKSAYKRGLDFLSKNLRVDNHHVSKSEIKRLVRPNCRALHALILPIRAKQILDGISDYIDYPEKSYIHDECRKMNRICLGKKNICTYYCYEYLIRDLIKQLDRISGNLKEGSLAKRIADNLIDNTKLCR